MIVLRLIFGNWLSRAYLILFALVWIAAAVMSASSSDGGFAYLYVLLVSLPGSVLLFPLMNSTPEPWAVTVASACVIFGALLNALLLGLIAAGVRRLYARTKAPATT